MSQTHSFDRNDLIKVLGSEAEADKLVDSVRVAANKRAGGHPAYAAPPEPEAAEAGAVETEQAAGEA